MDTPQIVGFAGAALVPSTVSLVAIRVNNARLSDLRADMNARFAELRADMNARFDLMDKLFTERLRRVEEVLDARLKHLEEERNR